MLKLGQISPMAEMSMVEPVRDTRVLMGYLAADSRLWEKTKAIKVSQEFTSRALDWSEHHGIPSSKDIGGTWSERPRYPSWAASS